MKPIVGIIGAGPAGLSAAEVIAKNCDAKIIIFELKKNLSSLSRSSAGIFDINAIINRGLGKSIIQKYDTFSILSFSGVKADYKYESDKFCCVSLPKMLSLLLKKAKKAGDVQVQYNRHIIDMFHSKGKVVVVDEERKMEHVDLLIDATGQRRFISRKLGLAPPHSFYVCYGHEIENCNNNNPKEIMLLVGKKGGPAGWYYPIGKTKARFGISEHTNYSEYYKDDLIQEYFNSARKITYISKQLKNARPIKVERGFSVKEPLHNFVFNQMMITGEAAGHVPPVIGEGIRHALIEGELCGKFASYACDKKDFSYKQLSGYEKFWKKKWLIKYLAELANADIAYKRSDKQWGDAVKRLRKVNTQEFLSFIRAEPSLLVMLKAKTPLGIARFFLQFLWRLILWNLREFTEPPLNVRDLT